jgi:hypothetical protein
MMSLGGGGGPLSGDNDVVWVQLVCLGRGGVEFSWSGLHGPQQVWGPNLGGWVGGGGLGRQNQVVHELVVGPASGWGGCSGGWMGCAHFLVLSSL